ncbi:MULTISPECIES: Crp/Fnr family transcriptional regulator [Flavobacteriaceae]|uniref:Crp/Fnr family transcriptional regulator n=1 Tax=Flavobacteriaceae TaxID=49546 RepID=UPI00234A8F40|nr:Crp/Fnr family transcriptional regulator [Muricauda sp. SP22]MDC6363170.1 Crp/Fnr family transcriptional regulator [Muricauda sp. SP22]
MTHSFFMEEPTNLLVSHLRETISLSHTEANIVANSFQLHQLKKKEVLLFAGDVSTHMRFIAQGCLRAYYMDEQAKEHIVQFGIEGWWVNDLYSYLTRTPAKQFVQALEPSIVLQIHRDTLNDLYNEVPAIERFYRKKFENAYVSLQDRTINAMSKTAEERYLEFRSKHRDIEQRVPQYMVASYLGVTPEFLSALRKDLR